VSQKTPATLFVRHTYLCPGFGPTPKYEPSKLFIKLCKDRLRSAKLTSPTTDLWIRSVSPTDRHYMRNLRVLVEMGELLATLWTT